MRNFIPLLFVILGLGLGFVLFKGAFGQTGAIPPTAPTGNVGSGFTYQGRLDMEGVPAEGNYDFQFKLYDAATGGSQVGSTVSVGDMAVAGGLFSVLLDFGADPFDDQARYLELAVREGTSSGAYSSLSPRQQLTAAPYALHAAEAGSVPWSGLSGVPAGLDDGDDLGLTSVAWDDVQALPPGFADGVDNVGLTNVDWMDVGSRPPGLDDGDNVGLTSVDWMIVENRPPGLDDGDDDTTYSAGAGLALGGTQFSVLSSTVQMRVAENCAAGSTIQTINADGSVVCAFADPLRRGAPPADNRITTLDSAGDVGAYTSVTIGSDGLPFIAYYDQANGDLKVAHCHDVACTSATATTVDAGEPVGFHTSVTIGIDGLPFISYFDNSTHELKVARCNDLACSSAAINTVEGAGIGAESTDVMIGSDGLPFISYLTNSELRAIHCSDANCASATITPLASLLNPSQDVSLAIGSDGLPIISYPDAFNANMMVAHCQVITCTSATIGVVDGSTSSGYTSITIGGDGLPILAYGGNDLTVAHCNDVACTTALRYDIDSAPNAVSYTSITIGGDGLPIISYFDASNNALKVAHCRSVACESASIVTLDSGSGVGWYPSITIGVDGLPLISYLDEANGDLKVAQCRNPFCLPYFRRR